MPEKSIKEFTFPELNSHTNQYDAMISGALTTDDQLKSHLEKLKGLQVISHIPPFTTEAIITFRYKNYEFTADNAYMVWSFWTYRDCPDEIILEIRKHLRGLVRT
jgi:hypothetical protein